MSSTKRFPIWPLMVIALPAMVALWGGWVGLGTMAGFGPVHLLPGIWNSATVNTAITLPIGAEVYGAYSVGAWLSERTPKRAKKFAKWSAWGSMLLGTFGQVSYHVLEATHHTSAPWEITVLVSALPVITFALATTLAHLIRSGDDEPELVQVPESVPVVESVMVPSTPVPVLESVPETELASTVDTAPEHTEQTVPERVSEHASPRVPKPRAKRAPSAKTGTAKQAPEHVFAEELSAGRLPSLRAVKAQMGVGTDKARAILADLASMSGQGVLADV